MQKMKMLVNVLRFDSGGDPVQNIGYGFVEVQLSDEDAIKLSQLFELSKEQGCAVIDQLIPA
jgi:hypothetical protein